jgi:HSP90 family molecular chaperone
MKNMHKDNTMELNFAHPIIVNLNQLRKTDKARAKLVAESLLDNVMIESNMPFDMQAGIDRRYKMINQFLELSTEQAPIQATRKVTAEPTLKQAEKLRNESSDK